jgi:hypothetical protein
MIVNDKLEKMWKEVFMANFKVLFQKKKKNVRIASHWTRFKPRISQT